MKNPAAIGHWHVRALHQELHWQQIQALYRLTVPAAIPNRQPTFNVCPTDQVDTVVAHEGNRELVQMRWGLVPYWWNKPLKELRLATFNARVETVMTKPFFREPFKHSRCLIPVSGYYEWQDTAKGKQPLYFTARWLASTDGRGSLGSVEKQGNGRTHKVVHDDNQRAERLSWRSSRPDARPPVAGPV